MAVPNKANRADRLYERAEGQGGYFTAADARAAGYDYPLQHFHVRRGNWVRVDRGIYRLRRFPHGDQEDLLRWWLWTRKLGAVSHESAAAVYELGDTLPSKVHLTVPPAFRKKAPDGVVLHKASLAASEVEIREGLRVTRVLRTILDLARAHLDPERLSAVVKTAVENGLADRRELLAVLAEMPKGIDPATLVTLQLAARDGLPVAARESAGEYPTMSKAQGAAFKARWARVAAAERSELRAASTDQKLRQLAALMASAPQLGWNEALAAEEIQARRQWQRLRQAYGV